MAIAKDVTLDKDTAEKVFQRAKGKLGICFCLWMVLCVPVLLALLLGGAVLAVANIVFAIQALVVGADTYQGPSCQRTVGVWLIVFGSLSIGSAVLNCLCTNGGKRNDKEGEKRKNGGLIQVIINLSTLANFGWLCYGVNLVYNRTDLQACNGSHVAKETLEDGKGKAEPDLETGNAKPQGEVVKTAIPTANSDTGGKHPVSDNASAEKQQMANV